MSCPEHLADSRAAPPAAAKEYDLDQVVAAMRSMSQGGPEDDGAKGPLERLAMVAVECVPGARWASVSMLRGGHFSTAASTAGQALRADLLQYELGSGPCVDAVLEDTLNLTGQVGTDARWGEWGRRATTEVGVNSVLSQRLHPEHEGGVFTGLNIYSDTRDAFDQAAVGVAVILATHGAVVLSEVLASQRAGNMSKALSSNREIGVAMGILMHQHHFTRPEAFDALRVASQNSNRKLAVIASEIADTGELAAAPRSPTTS